MPKCCLGRTKVVDSAHSGVHCRTRHVIRSKNGSKGVRQTAAAFPEAEKAYRILWILETHLDEFFTPRAKKKKRTT